MRPLPSLEDITWQVAESGQRSVIQSSPIDNVRLNQIKHLVESRLHEACRIDVTNGREPFEAYEVDIARPWDRLSTKDYPGDTGSRIEIRNTSPEQFTAATGLQVAHAQKWTRFVGMGTDTGRKL